jgi:hypothetical protein
VRGQGAQLAEREVATATRLGDNDPCPQPFGTGRLPCLASAQPARWACAAQRLRFVVRIGGPTLRVSRANRDELFAGTLIAFEKGRSWPRRGTLAKLEEVLNWPTGTITRIRNGAAVAQGGEATEVLTDTVHAPLMAEAVELAMHTIATTVEALPKASEPEFSQKAARFSPTCASSRLPTPPAFRPPSSKTRSPSVPSLRTPRRQSRRSSRNWR